METNIIEAGEIKVGMVIYIGGLKAEVSSVTIDWGSVWVTLDLPNLLEVQENTPSSNRVGLIMATDLMIETD